MSIFQFLRIFVARWLIIAVATVSAAIGAFIVASLVQPRYQAVAQVMLNLSKPDPVTGEKHTLVRGNSTLIDVQKQLILDYRVTGRVVDAFGWLSDPNLIRAYQSRNPTDTREFRRWLAQQVADRTAINFAGTILTISFSAPSAMEAKVGAETLRTAYIEESLQDRRNYARRYANWYSEQAETARKAAEEAQLAKAAFEKESGIILNDQGSDLDSQRLSTLAGQMSVSTAAAASMAAPSQTALQLAEVDSALALETQRLGPNHPRMVELRRQRAQLAEVREQELTAARNAASGISGAQAMQRAMEDQKSRVIGQRDKVERLRQLQTEIDLKRDEYTRTSARASQLALEAAVADSIAAPLGVVVAPNSPAFPNKKLMVGGATILGMGIGLALALLLELLNRRVRGVEDLNVASDIPCLGVVEEPGARARMGLSRLIHRVMPLRRAGAAA